MRDVERAGFVKLHDLRRNLGRLIEADVADAGRLIKLGDLAREQASDDRPALAADQVEEDLLALCLQLERLVARSEEHTSELQSLMRISYAVFCLKKKKQEQTKRVNTITNRNKRIKINIQSL